jgi:adenylyl-sulfate kinase
VNKIEIDTFNHVEADSLGINEIGIVEVETHRPILCDIYSENRGTGSFILIDPEENSTLAGGMILETRTHANAEISIPANRSQGRGLTVWLTGLSGAGKSTIADAASKELVARGMRVQVLDADVIRTNLSRGLGFSKEDRDENIRRIGFVASLLTRHGVIVLVAAISPYRSTRAEVRELVGDFIEVHVNTPLHICEQRDPKGLYRRARSREISHFTGLDDPYEEPLTPDLCLDTSKKALHECVEEILSEIWHRVF